MSPGGWGRGKKESARGTMGREERKRLTIAPRALIAIFTGIPSGRLCGGERSNRYFPLGGQRWRSGESTRLPPMRPGFKSRRQRYMWVLSLLMVLSLVLTARQQETL